LERADARSIHAPHPTPHAVRRRKHHSRDSGFVHRGAGVGGCVCVAAAGGSSGACRAACGSAVPVGQGLHGLSQVAQQVSGSRVPLPKPSPLRTGRDDLSSSGSSLCCLAPDPRVVRVMAPPV